MILLRRLLLIIACAAGALGCPAQTIGTEALRCADLLFVAPWQGNAITAVTQGYDNLGIDHVAMCLNTKKDTIRILESVPEKGVRTLPLDSFITLHREDVIVVGRINMPFDTAATLQHALDYCGQAYDSLYLPDNEAVYCSELVLNSYVDSLGQPLFSPIGMTFRTSYDTAVIFLCSGHQLFHYARHGMDVPEGKPGSNPGELSRRQQIVILGMLQTEKRHPTIPTPTHCEKNCCCHKRQSPSERGR